MSFPAICSTLKWNGNNLSTHLVSRLWYVLFPLLFFSADNNAWWSVWRVKCDPYKYYLKCSSDQTTANSSSSFILYRCSFLFRNLLAYAIGCELLFSFCSRHAPSPSLLASHLTRVSLFMLKCFCSIMFLIAFFMLLNAAECFSFHSSFFLMLMMIVVVLLVLIVLPVLVWIWLEGECCPWMIVVVWVF